MIRYSQYTSLHHAPGGMYKWTGNSCYIDTVLWCLFFFPNVFIDRMMLFSRPSIHRLHQIASCGKGLNDLNERIFLEFQALFRRISFFFRKMQGEIGNCNDFRSLYKKWFMNKQCSLLRKKTMFHSTQQNEAQDLLQFVLSLYGMNGLVNYGAVSQESFYYGIVTGTSILWKHITTRSDKKQSIVWNISFDSLSSSPIPSLSHLLSHTDDNTEIHHRYKGSSYNAMRTVQSLIEFADLLILSVERINPIHRTILRKKVVIPDQLADQKGKQLHLFAVVCHHGSSIDSGHYTAYSRYRNHSKDMTGQDQKWYYYDNMVSVRPITSQEMAATSRIMATHGVLFFYCLM